MVCIWFLVELSFSAITAAPSLGGELKYVFKSVSKNSQLNLGLIFR